MDEQEWIAAAKARFDFDGWPAARDFTASRVELVVRGFALSPDDPQWTFERRAAYGGLGYADLYRGPSSSQRALVEVAEHPTQAAARLGLLRRLSVVMAPALPRLDDVGEVAFGGHNDRDLAIHFVRANIVVVVRSIGDEPASILDLAKRIDREIQAQALITR